MADPVTSFCMVTTFYPPYHFGGDALYVYRLSNALARRGHHVQGGRPQAPVIVFRQDE